MPELIGTFGNLTYDQYRGIRFRRDRDPWAGGDFTLDLLPPGSIFHEPVGINLVEDGVVIGPSSTHMFDFDRCNSPMASITTRWATWAGRAFASARR